MNTAQAKVETVSSEEPDPETTRICVIGLGYVGLPLAVEFGRKFDTIGFDTKICRIGSLREAYDSTGEVTSLQLTAAAKLRFTSDETDLSDRNVFIVAVPTPIDRSMRPVLQPLLSASRTVGRNIKAGGVVVYESTVYPGATEEDCIPIVEQSSGLRLNKDFFAGYSPERISPGDKERSLTKIVKVTSGSTPKAARFIDRLYQSIIEAGTFSASSIRVAEAAKIIENTQRDVNIALINEMSIIFSHLGIDTNEVLDAAATKWNFIRLRPGLVGGHCIGVDPYYLLHKSMSAGYIPDIVRTAREINEGMARNAVSRLIRKMIEREIPIKGASVMILGFAFKENCRDIRNTKVVDLLEELSTYGIKAEVVDPCVDSDEVWREHSLRIAAELPAFGAYDAIILAVPHDEMIASGPTSLRQILKPGGILFDLKARFDVSSVDLRL
jgi:UDP-N-acetyl-D-galactosamine dehydrogenase